MRLNSRFTPSSRFDADDLRRSLEEDLVKVSKTSSDSPVTLTTPHQHHLVVPDDFEELRRPTKRLRVSDINIARYDEEFIELQEIAAGMFGKVKIARHRFDGMIYAIKVPRLRK